MATTAPPLLFTSRSGEIRTRRWTLEVLDGQDKGRTCIVDRSPALVGAAPAAILVLTDDTVSRYHCEMDIFAEGIRIRDLDSTNGTFVGQQQVRDAFIENGETFRLGRTSIRLIGDDEPAAPEVDTDPFGVPLGAVERVGDALGVSTKLRGLFEILRQVSRSPSPVMLAGEPGTGKSTCARLVHDLSPRKAHPFITINVPYDADAPTLESMLFGRSDAHGMRGSAGAFERANGGTLFLKNVDRVPTATQPRLLRVVESAEVRRNGDRRRRRIDVRLISSATDLPGSNPGLSPTVLRRLAVVRLTVPPLRDRPDDIAPLAAQFLKQAGQGKFQIGPRLETGLLEGRWPNNGEELRTTIRALIGQPLHDEPLRVSFVHDIVDQKRGDVTAAAEALEVGQRELFRFLSRHDVDLDAM